MLTMPTLTPVGSPVATRAPCTTGDREEEGAGERRQPERRAEVVAGRDQVRAGDGADRRRPDNDRKVAAAALWQREVGRGEARLQVDRRADTDECEPHEQQREEREDRRDDTEQRAEGGTERAAGKRRRTPLATGERRERDGRCRRTERRHRRRHPRERR
jgi:hypothetical protein